MGTINGDVECLGNLNVSGKIKGNCSAADISLQTAERLEGSLKSEGNVKIETGTVVIGDINATSAFIAGAVKGNIDIAGNIILDSTAVIKGDIKAKSIQINPGAILEGFCSLVYASVEVDSIFE